jgi:anti-sigma factor RsiW
MKPCKINSRISAYLDNELDPRLSESVARHLQECVDCQEEAARLSVVYDLLKQDHLTVNDPYLLTRVRSHLSRQVDRSFLPGWVGRFFVPATVVFGLVLGFVLGNGLNNSILDQSVWQAETLTDSGVWSESSSLASQYVQAFSDGTTETGEDHD